MKVKISFEYIVDLPDCKINTITSLYKKMQAIIFADIVMSVLTQFGTEYMKAKKKPFACECGNNEDFKWKTKKAKLTKIMTIFCEII